MQHKDSELLKRLQSGAVTIAPEVRHKAAPGCATLSALAGILPERPRGVLTACAASLTLGYGGQPLRG